MHLYLSSGTISHVIRDHPQCSVQGAMLQGKRSQIPNGMPGLGLGVAQHRLGDLQNLSRRIRRMEQLGASRLDLKNDSRELLFNGVMKFPRDSGALFQDGFTLNLSLD